MWSSNLQQRLPGRRNARPRPHPSATDPLFIIQLCLTLWLQGLQHIRLPCPSPSPRRCWNSCPLSWWCYLTSSSSAALFFCFQSFPASGSFPVSQLFTSGSQSIRASTLASILPMNIQGWFPLGLTGLTLLFKGLSRVFSSTMIWQHPFFGSLYGPVLTSIHDYWIICIHVYKCLFTLF